MLKTLRYVIFLLALSYVQAATEPAQTETVFSSGDRHVALIELFTSEGCSSCPPADRWLSALKSDPDLWDKFAPIAFHVDYWDYIGWKDRFATAEFSQRQRNLVAEGGARFAYTPAFFRDGQEWRHWRNRGPAKRSPTGAGELRLRIDKNAVDVHFAAVGKNDDRLTVNIAVLGMQVETDVRAGENKGKKLRHDFVALGVTTVPLERIDGSYRATTRLPKTSPRLTEQALVAWVSAAGKHAPIQAVGGYLPLHR